MLDFEPLPGAVHADLRAAYLTPWRAAYPGIDVERAFEAARPLTILYAALVRWFRWLPAMTPREKWEFMIALWYASCSTTRPAPVFDRVAWAVGACPLRGPGFVVP